MRMLLRFSIPTDIGNELIQDGRMGDVIGRLMDDLHPEAAYFFPQDGRRGGIAVFDLQDPADIAIKIEPLFLALDADIELTPVMVAEDLQRAFPALEDIANELG